MDLLQSLLSDRDEVVLLTDSNTLDGLDMPESFPLHTESTSQDLNEKDVGEARGTDTLWDEAFKTSRMLMSAPMLDLGPSQEDGRDASELEVTAVPTNGLASATGGSTAVKADETAMSFPNTLEDADFSEEFCEFSLAALRHADMKPAHVDILPRQQTEDAPQDDASETYSRKAPEPRRAVAAGLHLSKQKDKESDDVAHQPSARGKPRDKTTQRKLRNKESARRYREKQVAKRRQLENFTRNLADQNQQLEMLHDKLLSLTCGHPVARSGTQVSSGPLQDINK